MSDGQSEACEENGPHPGRSEEWLEGYRTGWAACVQWYVPNQVEPLLREIKILQEHVLFMNEGGPRAD